MAKGKYQQWLEPEGLILLVGWARDGLTDAQIAKNMGITRKTLYMWKGKYSDICSALKKGKAVADYEVENALFKRAIGYNYIEETHEYEDGMLTKTKTIKKEVLPDVTAQIFWLKNRKPKHWRDKIINEDGHGSVEDLTPLSEMLKIESKESHD